MNTTVTPGLSFTSCITVAYILPLTSPLCSKESWIFRVHGFKSGLEQIWEDQILIVKGIRNKIYNRLNIATWCPANMSHVLEMSAHYLGHQETNNFALYCLFDFGKLVCRFVTPSS